MRDVTRHVDEYCMYWDQRNNAIELGSYLFAVIKSMPTFGVQPPLASRGFIYGHCEYI